MLLMLNSLSVAVCSSEVEHADCELPDPGARLSSELSRARFGIILSHSQYAPVQVYTLYLR